MRFSTLSTCLMSVLAIVSTSAEELETKLSSSDSNKALLAALAQPTSPALYHDILIAHLAPPSNPPADPPVNELELRQAVGAAGGVQASSVATQMSPITTYLIHGSNGVETPVAYTQLFSQIPDQWPSPTAGTIGLGTISGTVGAVKTNTKRSVWATAEALVERGLAVRRSNDGAGRSSDVSVWKVIACLLGVAGIMGVL